MKVFQVIVVSMSGKHTIVRCYLVVIEGGRLGVRDASVAVSEEEAYPVYNVCIYGLNISTNVCPVA